MARVLGILLYAGGLVAVMALRGLNDAHRLADGMFWRLVGSCVIVVAAGIFLHWWGEQQWLNEARGFEVTTHEEE